MLMFLVFFKVSTQFDDRWEKAAALKYESMDIRKWIHSNRYAPTKRKAMQIPIAITINIAPIAVKMAAVPTIPRKTNGISFEQNIGRRKAIK
jgi:hypothetical protein